VVRPVIFWSAGLLLALWVLLGLVSLADALFTDCATGPSEIGDPCADGKATDLLYGSLIWLAGAVPLAAILVAAGRRGR
jgi:hypothetical protein